MIEEKITNPPAFPTDQCLTVGNVTKKGWEGMSLRDYFAEGAMRSIIATGENACMQLENTQGLIIADAIAQNAYFMADAMLKARVSCPPPPSLKKHNQRRSKCRRY